MIVDVGPVAHGGHCVARAEGRVIFVRHALPGERVRIRITERKAKYWRADAVEILHAAPDRVEPPCRFAGVCGGCDLQHVSAAGQLSWKTEVLREQLVRLGGLRPDQVGGYEVEPLPGGLLGWRRRVQFAVTREGRAGLRRHRSHDVVHVDGCVIAAPGVPDAEVLAGEWAGSGAVGVVSADDDETAVYTQRSRAGRARLVSGPQTLHYTARGRRFTVGFDAFWQVHPAAADAFADTVLDQLRPRPGERAWDLYGGAGLFAAGLAEAVGERGRVSVVESDPSAMADANLADLPQAEVVYGDVTESLPDLPQPDIVVLDPPRNGAGTDLVAGIADVGPRAVAYVACDPAALARDLRAFTEHGFTLTALRAFDAFPMTHHFETIALLT